MRETRTFGSARGAARVGKHGDEGPSLPQPASRQLPRRRVRRYGPRVTSWPAFVDHALPHEQPVENEQPDRVRPACERSRRGPWSTRHIDGAREEALADLADSPRVKTTSELGVCLK